MESSLPERIAVGIDPAVTKVITSRLSGLEKAEVVRVGYAVESGSRAWGFASVDSDYDVRFLYVRKPEWYFSVNVERRRDVIELPIDGDLDINGWDLRKACQLLRKSNPPLLEWLHSPIVYRDRFGLAQKLRDLLPLFFSAKACSYHYLSMAKNNYRSIASSRTSLGDTRQPEDSERLAPRRAWRSSIHSYGRRWKRPGANESASDVPRSAQSGRTPRATTPWWVTPRMLYPVPDGTPSGGGRAQA